MVQISPAKCLSLFIFTGLLFCIGCNQQNETKLVITGHRGASGMAPENTLAAFRKAIELGADYSELDVQLTKDDQVVLLHDETLDRTTTGTGGVREYTLAELKKLDAGSYFSPEFAGEQMPTLGEVIRFVKGKMKLDIEIKISGDEPGIVQKVIDIVRSEGFTSDCMITSFDQATVEEVKHIAPELMTGLIINEYKNDNEFKGNWDVLGVKYTLVDKDFVKKAEAANKPIHVYTVNDVETMKKLIELRVAGIITNYPNRLKDALAESQK
jgi:glycerophosphoryl diester phosphodiesterase